MQEEKGKYMIFKGLLVGFTGICGGLLVAAGVFAFIVIIGAVTRLIARTNTGKYAMLYENIIILGATSGNLIFIFNPVLPVKTIGLIIFGGFAGMFIGCLSASLAEMLKVMPAFEKRIHFQKGIAVAITAFAIGKTLGSLLWLL